VLPLEPKQEISLATKKGMSIRFKEDQVRPMGRTAYGVRGIRLRKGDEVASAEVVDSSCWLFSVTEKGYGKMVACSKYKVQSRGGTGIINVKCSDKNGDVVRVKRAGPKDEFILVTDSGRTIRFNLETVSEHNRGGLGVKLMDLAGDEKIRGVGLIGED
jgi:DNA gyrase subunit A